MAKSVLIFVPAFRGQITAATFMSSHAICNTLRQSGMACGINTMSWPDIAELRNIALTMWYDTMPTVSHLCFMDDDMGVAPQLLLDMLASGHPLVGALYPQRVLPIQFAGSGFGVRAPVKDGFMPVEGVGMGFTLISRVVVREMLEKITGISDHRVAPYGAVFGPAGVKRIIRAFDKIDDPERGWMSEDLSFCRRWRECGGEVMAATHHRISHVGQFSFEGCFAEWAKSQQAAE